MDPSTSYIFVPPGGGGMYMEHQPTLLTPGWHRVNWLDYRQARRASDEHPADFEGFRFLMVEANREDVECDP